MANKKLMGAATSDLRLPAKKDKSDKKPKWQGKFGKGRAKVEEAVAVEPTVETPEIVVEEPTSVAEQPVEVPTAETTQETPVQEPVLEPTPSVEPTEEQQAEEPAGHATRMGGSRARLDQAGGGPGDQARLSPDRHSRGVGNPRLHRTVMAQ